MRTRRERKKKLAVAFHFYRSAQAGWDCDSCRKAGLEMKRRCSWIPEASKTPVRPVWVRNGVALNTCPRSVVTAESTGWFEEFQIWRKFGSSNYEQMEARKLEAFLVLGAELERERSDDRQDN